MSESSITKTLPSFIVVGNAPKPSRYPYSPLLSREETASRGSGDDIRDVRIDDQLNSISEHELAPLEARKLKLIACRLRAEQLDPLVELPVLRLECFQHASRMIVVHCRIESSAYGPSSEPSRCSRRAAPAHGRAVRRAKTRARIRGLLCLGDTLTERNRTNGQGNSRGIGVKASGSSRPHRGRRAPAPPGRRPSPPSQERETQT